MQRHRRETHASLLLSCDCRCGEPDTWPPVLRSPSWAQTPLCECTRRSYKTEKNGLTGLHLSATQSTCYGMLAKVRQGQGTQEQVRGAYAPKARLFAPQLGHINSHEHGHGHGAGDSHHHIPPVPREGLGCLVTWGETQGKKGWEFSLK